MGAVLPARSDATSAVWHIPNCHEGRGLGTPGHGKPSRWPLLNEFMHWMYSLESKQLSKEAKRRSQEMFVWLWSDPVWQWLVTELAQGAGEGCRVVGHGVCLLCPFLALQGACCSFVARLSSF